jgi:SAM-dependent methyltransferase
MSYGRCFFESYCTPPRGSTAPLTIVDIGSQDVNGSLRNVAPAEAKYIGLDFVEGTGVDAVLSDPYVLPLPDACADAVVCSSCFEHSEFFWLVFLEIMRILKPDGVFYLNAPSNGYFHRYPVDCWRFYPDAGHALVSWGKRNGMVDLMLLESFIGERSQHDVWHDFVAVFLKDGRYASKYPKRIFRQLESFSNGYSSDANGVLHFDKAMPDWRTVVAYTNRINTLTEEVRQLKLNLAKLQQGSLT